MSSEWQRTTVEALAAPRPAALATGPFGSSIAAKYFTHAGVPVIRGSNLSADVSTRLIDEGLVFVSDEKATEFHRSIASRGDLVFTCWGTINQVGLIDGSSKYDRYVVSNKQMKLSVDPTKVESQFLYYLFSGPEKQSEILDNGIGSSVPGFNLGQLKKHEVLLPPLAEQRQIVAALSSLDTRIALLRKTNATFEAIAQALFKSWFVDFDPVHAKQQGFPPAGMDEATVALLPDSLELSELGLVPKGWRAGSLADLADLNSESWSARSHPERIAYVDLANAKDNEIAAAMEFAFDDAPSRARRVLRSGDTIVGTVRPGNRSFAFVHDPAATLTASTGFAVLRPRAQESTAYVYLAATQDSSIEYLAHVADGGAYPAVRPDVVSALACVVPPNAILLMFNAVACPLLAKVSANQVQAQTLTTLRDTLLPRLISGRLRLPEVEEALG